MSRLLTRSLCVFLYIYKYISKSLFNQLLLQSGVRFLFPLHKLLVETVSKPFSVLSSDKQRLGLLCGGDPPSAIWSDTVIYAWRECFLKRCIVLLIYRCFTYAVHQISHGVAGLPRVLQLEHLKKSPLYQTSRAFRFLLLQCHWLLLFFYTPAMRLIIRLSKAPFWWKYFIPAVTANKTAQLKPKSKYMKYRRHFYI